MNKSTFWKEFGKNPLTHSTAHYLMAIHQLLEEKGYARLIDVAATLGISKGSLSTSLKPLITKKFIYEDEHKHLFLSDLGKLYALHIENTYSVVKHFLENILGVQKDQAEIDACKVEHLLGVDTTDKILKLVKALENNPELLKVLKKEMTKYKNCSLDGCKKCYKEGFCLD